MHPRERCVLPDRRADAAAQGGGVRPGAAATCIRACVDAHFSHGTVTNYWGGSSIATTRMLEDLHYRGWLRVARREKGIRVYAPRELFEPPR